VATLLLLLLWPVLLATALVLRVVRRGPVVFRKEALRLPAPTDPAQWRTFTLLSFAQDGNDMQKEHGSALKHFLLRFLPGLISVAKRNLRIIGVSPRTEKEVKALSQDWRALYLKTKAGLVSEAYINYGDAPTEDERYTSEAFYSVASGFGHDLKIFFAYLGRILKGFPPSAKGGHYGL
jgi:lipopolysaccharide/colanic/teichoic acid biosynthesis glycosyltransferase